MIFQPRSSNPWTNANKIGVSGLACAGLPCVACPIRSASLVEHFQRRFKVALQRIKWPAHGTIARNQHIVPSWPAELREPRPRRRPESPAGPVAFDRIADLFGHREPEADRFCLDMWLAVPTRKAEQHESWFGCSHARVDGQELASPFQGRNRLQRRWLMQKGACAPWPGAALRPCGRQHSPCAGESHDGACGQGGSVDRCASWARP